MEVTAQRRPDRHEYYLAIAKEVARRSTCRRRQFGAVIVNNEEIISTGYGGAPRDTPNCCDIGVCYRAKLGARSGEHYEFCRAVHAEQNAIIHASRRHMRGADLYLVGLDAANGDYWADCEPCRICKRIIVNAGIERVIVARGEGKVAEFLVGEWVRAPFDAGVRRRSPDLAGLRTWRIWRDPRKVLSPFGTEGYVKNGPRTGPCAWYNGGRLRSAATPRKPSGCRRRPSIFGISMREGASPQEA